MLVLTYGILNALFALAYLVGEENIANAQSGVLWGCLLFFSVQTLASIGYGAMYPQTHIR